MTTVSALRVITNHKNVKLPTLKKTQPIMFSSELSYILTDDDQGVGHNSNCGQIYSKTCTLAMICYTE